MCLSLQSLLQGEITALRSELEKAKGEATDLLKELDAVNYHRTVLRDTVDQLERKVKQMGDTLGSLQTQLERAGGDFTASLGLGAMDVSSPISSPISSAVNSPVRGVGATTGAARNGSTRTSTAGGGGASLRPGSGGAGSLSAEDEEALRRQVMRYKVRAAAMEELASVYRTSVLALYADGASYGAAQFGWQPMGVPQEFSSRDPRARGTAPHRRGLDRA